MSDVTKKLNREHRFDWELAVIVGIEKAILLKNIDYWCAENRRRSQEYYYEDGIWWTEESLASLARKYPYMKRPSIGRWMQELADSGWIVVKADKWRNKYAVGEVLELWDNGGDWRSKLSHFETNSGRLKMRQKLSQNETSSVSKWDESRLKMGQTPILNSDLNIELNDIVNGAAAPVPEKKSDRIKRESAEALEYLNEKCGKKFQLTSANLKFPSGRLQGGAALDDLKLIVDCYCCKWKGKTFGGGQRADEYLRPSTLFQAEKFDAYLAEARRFEKEQKQSQTGVLSDLRDRGIYK